MMRDRAQIKPHEGWLGIAAFLAGWCMSFYNNIIHNAWHMKKLMKYHLKLEAQT